MKEWIKISDLLFFQEGPGVRNTQYTQSGVKLLNVANLVNGKVDLSTSDRYISEDEAYGRYKHFLCDDGDFIIASSGIKVEYFDRKMGFVDSSMLPLCMNTSTIRFKVIDSKRLNIKYFMYYLKSIHFKQQLSKFITGSAQLNFGPSHLKKMNMPLVSLKEQNDIVEKLSKVELLLDKYNGEIKLLDELIKARFVEMFGNPANNPYNFSKMKLGKICDVRDGTHDSPKYQTVGYPLITSKNLTSGEIDFSNCNYIKEEDYKKINLRSEVTRGDIIMPMIGTIGNPIIVNTDIRFAIKNVALIKFNKNTLQNIYVKYFLGSDYFDFSVLRNIRGGTQKFIALKDLRDLDILVPPLELQNQFASFVQEIDKSGFIDFFPTSNFTLLSHKLSM